MLAQGRINLCNSFLQDGGRGLDVDDHDSEAEDALRR